MIKKYFENKKEKRTKVIVPDSAHGTNPASSSFAGLEVVEVKSNEEGILDVENVKKVVGKDVACLMLTIPNTLGLFEKNILKITKIAKDEGIILYLDGANLNAFVGIVKPKEMGIDIVHFNLHKTFGTPHGTGGPGGGGIGVVSFLKEYLPIPRIKKEKEKYTLKYNFPNSIGVVHSFYGNFSVSVRAYFYLRMLGGEGLEEVAYNSVLNANYLMQKLKNHFYIPYSTFCMHEFVISCEPQVKNYGVRALDIAKRLLDYGFHPPTIYFPLIVKEALMVEPTETEDLTTLDNFVSALLHILSECKHSPNIVKQAPHCMPVKRLDEVYAAKMLKVNYYEDD
jgi:glycine dehydrogenase subunit 2